MEGFGGLGVSDVSSSVRKKRSITSRRPRNDSQPPLDNRGNSSPSDISKGSSDDNDVYGSAIRKKEISVNLCSSRASFSNNGESASAKNVLRNEDGGFADSDEASNNGSFLDSNDQKHGRVESKRFSKGMLAPANWTSSNKTEQSEFVSDDFDNENEVKKVKLKVGSVTRTIRTKSVSDGASAVGSSTTKASRVSDAPRPRQVLKQDLDETRSFTSEKEHGLGVQGSSWKVSKIAFKSGKTSSVGLDEDIDVNETEKNETIRKSKRVSKRRLMEEVLDDGDEDSVEYLEKYNTSRAARDYSLEFKDDKERESKKQRKTSKVSKRNPDVRYDVNMGDYISSRSRRETKKSRAGRILDDIDYEEEISISEDEPNRKKKKPRKEYVDSIVDAKNEMTVTTRQRALQTGKDVASSLGANLIKFPNGLPPAPPRKQKEKLSEVEQQLKKAEAAQRRRVQVEKAARESEAEAIRKILGQDSSRKKREEKIRKQKEDLAQERAANSMIIASDSVRWVMGPSGTIVTFPNEMGLPTIFDSKPCSYPPPREKCAGPSCTNPYKYRDSESKLPLCSLHCYKAIHEKMRPRTAMPIK